MSQHPSLRLRGKGKKFRSVLKRFERLRHLKDKEKWDEETSIFGLPKMKILKFKVKKEKAAAAEAVPAGTAPVAPGEALAGAEAKKPQELKKPTEAKKVQGAAKPAKEPKKEVPSKKEAR